MSEETVNDLAKLEASFGRQITLQDVVHESGLQMLRIRIKEGSRFTILDIDSETANEWGKLMENWAARTNSV